MIHPPLSSPGKLLREMMAEGIVVMPGAFSALTALAAYKQGLLDKPRTTAILYVDKRNLQVYKKKVDTPPISKVIGFCKEVLIAEKKFQETGILEERDNCFNCIRELRVK